MNSAAMTPLERVLSYVDDSAEQMIADLMPCANADEANHAPNENLELDRFVSGVRIAAAVYEAMARVNSPE